MSTYISIRHGFEKKRVKSQRLGIGAFGGVMWVGRRCAKKGRLPEQSNRPLYVRSASNARYFVFSFSVMSVGRMLTVMQLFCFKSTDLANFWMSAEVMPFIVAS